MNPHINFNRRHPHILVVDDFYVNPDAIRNEALQTKYEVNDAHYKGRRSNYKFLFPFVKEEFERLLQCEITDWLQQPMNGVFQVTDDKCPLVWHSDGQDYAGAIYLTPGEDDIGTSFWRSKTGLCRRPSDHPLEGKDPSLCNEIYSDYNLLHEDNWTLVDKVGSVYNRLVLWDAKLIHSASLYKPSERLVQLFFFNIRH